MRQCHEAAYVLTSRSCGSKGVGYILLLPLAMACLPKWQDLLSRAGAAPHGGETNVATHPRKHPVSKP